jgi:tetratricopeptide (TPR) repeat protein
MAVFFLSTGAFAQEKSTAELNQEFEQSFQAMLKNPADVDITMQYAKIAVSLGNFEAAIPPLERILIFNPNLPKIKLELGVLYYKLDSMKMAKSYFKDAAASAEASDEVKASANEYLGKIKG